MEDKLLNRKDKKQLLEYTNSLIHSIRPLFPFVMPYHFSVYIDGPFVALESMELGVTIQFMLKGKVLEFCNMNPGRCNGDAIAKSLTTITNGLVGFLNMRSRLSFPVDRINFMMVQNKKVDVSRLANGNLVAVVSM